MAEKDKRLIALGKGSSGGGGDAVWGSIGGTITDQTDLMTQLNKKANKNQLATVATSGSYNDLSNKPTIPTKTSDLTNDSDFITSSDIPAQVQSDWNESDNTSPAYIDNKPTIPTVNDSTITFEDSEGTTIDSFTLNQSSNKTITIPSGGGNAWYGTNEQFDAIPQAELDDTCTYYISDNIDYSEITNTPFIPTNTSDLNNNSGFTTTKIVDRQLSDLVDYMDKKEVWLSKSDYDALALAGKLEEGKNYHIEHNVDILEMVVTFTDQTTATYNVYIQPAN